MVSSVTSNLPSVSQLLNPVNPVTGKVQTSSAQTPTSPTTTSGNNSTGALSPTNNVSLTSEILGLLQGGADSSSGSNPIASLLGGNSGSTGSSLTSLYTNLFITAAASSISANSNGADAQKSVATALNTDPIQVAINAYNNAANSAQTASSSGQTTSA